jgi:HSP20 family molecular chaperone IbpA
MGASLGGLISTYLALSRPHLFSKVAGQSSAFFLEQDKIAALARNLNEPLTFYFDVGKYEPQFIPAHRRLVPLLEAKGSSCFFQELAGGHNWTSWRAHLKDLLTFLWGGGIPSSHVSDKPEVEPIPPPVWEPTELQWDMDALLNRFLSGWERLFPGWLRPSSWDPQTEIAMEGDKLICRIALPGVDPRNLEVLVVGPQLVIRGERKASTQGQGDGNSFPLYRSQFERTFPLPEGVNADNLTARYHNGVLEIAMPAPKGMTPRRIPIE